ncbi:alpha/beta hydrolase family protein [Flavobacterium anhuiense]|uniref:alpha/beta hydrolase family protein n=1 Tax=Flavobacterium anhuiense TaxID=459526 RepID=UPI000E6C37A1|nr:prolyl oligopeptidase family serine peptidase [Flavobacterium anhuiense]
MKNMLIDLTASVRIFFLTAVLLTATCHVQSQVSKKAFLTRNDYRFWHTIENPKISAKGNWISFALKYKSGNDTLVVKNIELDRIVYLAKATNGSFFNEQQFLFLKNDTLGIMQLSRGKITRYPNITQFRILEKQGMLATLEKSENGYKFVLRSLSQMRVKHEVVNVSNWLFSPDNDSVALFLVQGNTTSVKVLELFGKINAKTIAQTSDSNFEDFIWQIDGKRLGFRTVQNGEITALNIYDTSVEKNYTLHTNELPQHHKFNKHTIYMDALSGYVFIGASIARSQPIEGDVQIWNTNDLQLYPQIAKIGVRPIQTVFRWLPLTHGLVKAIPDGFSRFILNATGQYALLFDNSKDRSYSSRDASEDIYLHKIGTNQTTLILRQFPGSPNRTIASPGGRYFTFYFDGNWQSVECATGKIINMTKNLTNTLSDNEASYSGARIPYDRAIWTKEDKSLMVTDAFDIFDINIADQNYRRLTHGRENGIKFRFSDTGLDPIAYYAQNDKAVDLKVPIILTAEAPDMEKSGYYSLKAGQKEQKIYYEELSASQIKKARDKDRYLIIEEDFHIAPRIQIVNDKNANRLVYQSNRQQQKFYWGKAERIWFKNNKGIRIPATLCYPANYNPLLKYPMVVKIYQRQSGSLHRYYAPSLGVQAGINVGNLTTQGYFVLLPDIIYEVGEPGKSALDCTMAAVDNAIGHASIDASKIGLIGHSFGGYESAFIATQTNRFATIVLGSGATDLITNYLKVSVNGAGPDFWRFESDQYRIKKGLYEDFSKYLENSPIYHAKRITSPLLTYSGTNDGQVSPLQAMELWLASLKLGKQHVMLLYPNEEHVFHTPSNKEDLCIKIEQWFGHYLKGEKYPDWAKPEQDRY